MYIQGVKKCRIFWDPPKQEKKKKSNKHGSGNAYFPSSVHLFLVAKTEVSNTVRGGRPSAYHNMNMKDHYTWVQKRILSATCTLVHRRRSTWRSIMTHVIGGAKHDIRPWQCIHLTFGCSSCNWVLRRTSTSQVISVTFYIERERSDKFFSEALISAWGSFTCRKSTTRDQRLYFPSEESHTQDFYALKKIHRTWPGLKPRTSDPVASMITTGPPGRSSALRQRVFPYSICSLDVYLICHGGGLTIKRRQPIRRSVQISKNAFPDLRLFNFFCGYYHLSKYSILLNTLYLYQCACVIRDIIIISLNYGNRKL